MKTATLSVNHHVASSAGHHLPELELLIAVLDRAVLDYYGTDTELRRSAAEWLFDESANDDGKIFSFDWLCTNLALERKEVVKSIRALRLRQAPAQGHRWLRKKVKSSTT